MKNYIATLILSATIAGSAQALVLQDVGTLLAEGVDVSPGASPGWNGINSTSEAEYIYDLWVNSGKPNSGAIGGGYTAGNTGSSRVSAIDLAGTTSGSFDPTLPYPGAPGVGGDHFLVNVSGAVQLAAGDYTLHVKSDDGFSFQLDTLMGDNVNFTKFGYGSTQGDSNELRYEGPTGNSNTGGYFTLSQDSIFDVNALFFEQGGGDYFEVAIAPYHTTGYGHPSNGYSQFAHGALGDNVQFGLSAVPEPSTYALFGMAFLGLGIAGYRKRRAA